MHKRHGQLGFHFFIFDLKMFNVLLILIDSGTKDHILGARYDILSVPCLTLFGFLLYKLFKDLRLYETGLSLKNTGHYIRR